MEEDQRLSIEMNRESLVARPQEQGIGEPPEARVDHVPRGARQLSVTIAALGVEEDADVEKGAPGLERHEARRVLVSGIRAMPVTTAREGIAHQQRAVRGGQLALI